MDTPEPYEIDLRHADFYRIGHVDGIGYTVTCVGGHGDDVPPAGRVASIRDALEFVETHHDRYHSAWLTSTTADAPFTRIQSVTVTDEQHTIPSGYLSAVLSKIPTTGGHVPFQRFRHPDAPPPLPVLPLTPPLVDVEAVRQYAAAHGHPTAASEPGPAQADWFCQTCGKRRRDLPWMVAGVPCHTQPTDAATVVMPAVRP